MKYQPPVGGAPDESYVDGNPATGTEGSAVPSKSIEHPMREIIAAIAASGLTPDENDLTQLSQAIALLAAAAAPAVEGFAVGDLKQAMKSAPDAGWLLLNGDTIGKTGSGAIKANDVYQNLYKSLWDNVSNAYAPVDGGRGANAQADWDAGKVLQMPDGRGRSGIGAGTGSGLTLNLALGQTYGEEKHTQTTAEMPPHSHTVRSGNDTDVGGLTPYTSNAIKNKTYATEVSGSGTPFNVVHPVLALNWFIKYGSGA